MPDAPETDNRRTLRRDVLLIAVSAILSGAVAFGVARYTVAHDDRIQDEVAAQADRLQDEAAVQERLSAVYLPLNAAISEVVSCIPLGACSDPQVYRAGRAANRAVVRPTASVQPGSAI